MMSFILWIMPPDEKLLKKIRDGRSNVRIEDLARLMESYGFSVRRTTHGYLFSHHDLTGVTMPHVPISHGREKKVLRHYVGMCILGIDALFQRREEE